MKTPREIGDDLESYVNEILNLKPVINSGASNRTGDSLGFDHMHERFIGESKVRSKKKAPNFPLSDYNKLLKKAIQEGHKDWFYVVQFDDGGKTTITLDLDVFAELTYPYFNQEEDDE